MTVSFSVRIYQKNGVRQVLGNYQILVGDKFEKEDVKSNYKIKSLDLVSEYDMLFSAVDNGLIDSP